MIVWLYYFSIANCNLSNYSSLAERRYNLYKQFFHEVTPEEEKHGEIGAFASQGVVQCLNPLTGCYYTYQPGMNQVQVCPGNNTQGKPAQPPAQVPQQPTQPQQPPSQGQSQAPPPPPQQNQQVPPQSQQPPANQPSNQNNNQQVLVCKPKERKPEEQPPRDVITPDFNLSKNGVKKITTVTVTRGDCRSPLQKVKDINPELGKQIEKILDFHGITEPWNAYDDLISPRPHQMPDWCNMYKKMRAMFKVFESLKELISDQFMNIEKFISRGKEYMNEYARDLKRDLDLMITFLRKMKASKDYSTKDEYMRKFNTTHCQTQEIISKYKNLRSWLVNTIKAFSSMFYPYNVNRFV